MKVNRILLVVSFFAVLVAILSIKSCSDESSGYDNLLEALKKSDSLVTHYQYANGLIVASKRINEVQSAQDIEALTQKNVELQALLKKFKTVNSTATIYTKYYRDSILIPFHDSIPCIDTIPFLYADKYLKLNGSITKRFLLLDSISVFNKIDIVIGERKMGFFKRNELSVDITNSNKYMNVYGVSSYMVKPPKKWFESKLLWLGVGATATYFILK